MKETGISPCPQWSTKLAARHAHDLTTDERIELNQHLKSCSACASIYASYAAMETRIRSLPAVTPLATLPLATVEGDRQTILSIPMSAAQSTKLRTRENGRQLISRHSRPTSFSRLPRVLEMGLALAVVACIIAASLTLFQRGHMSTTTASPQDIYHQIISNPPTFYDPLSGPNVNTSWDQWARCYYAGSAYHVTAAQYVGTACFDEGRNLRNFAFQAKMTILKGDTGGIIFRSNPSASGNASRIASQRGITVLQTYTFTVSTDDTYSLNVSPGRGCKILASGYSSAIQNGLPQSTILTVVARGSSIYLYINGQFVALAHDSTASSGNIGLFAASMKDPTDVTFSDVKVWQLP